MKKIVSLWDAVGNTPLLKIPKLSIATGNEIVGKAEFMNPGGSVKDRTAKGIIQAAEKTGLLKPGETIVEGTAGNTGIGLAVLGNERGYRVVLTMPDNQSHEKYDVLQALGAEVIKVPPVPFANPNHFYHQARALGEANGWFWANQFENTANADFHYETTGPEIWEQCEGKLDVFVASAGTGGTFSGVSRFLKKQNPKIRTVLVDPMGSGLYAYVQSGVIETTGSSITEGIGIMRITANFKSAMVDEAMRIDDQKMLEMFFHLSEQEGMLVGTSAALNVRAAYEMASVHRSVGLRIVTVLCDHGSRYASRVLDKAFLRTKGLEPQKHWMDERDN